MKTKLSTLFLFILVSLCALPAQELSGKLTKAKMEIFKYLQKNTRNVQDVGKGNLRFEAEGIHFDILVNSKEIDPLYLIISAAFTVPEEYYQDLLMEAGLLAADNKPVYVNTYKNTIVFDCEMYAKDAEPFISVLPAMVKAIKESANNFEAEYRKLHRQKEERVDYNNTTNNEEKASNSNYKSIATYFASDETEYNFPSCQNACDKGLYVSKVIRNNKEIILEFISYNNREFQNCTINRHSYLFANGQKYLLTYAEGISYSPEYTDYPNWQSRKNVSLTFRLHFPALPASVKQFDFNEGIVDGWIIKNILLDSNGLISVTNGNTISTLDHHWKVLSIQVTPHHTVVKKSVTPNTSGTYMYSSQGEYIQDADTGQKFYLVNSSLGFEGNPTISFETTEHTFCEVYPTLPSNVKRINISSGSQYYVQNLSIK